MKYERLMPKPFKQGFLFDRDVFCVVPTEQADLTFPTEVLLAIVSGTGSIDASAWHDT